VLQAVVYMLYLLLKVVISDCFLCLEHGFQGITHQWSFIDKYFLR